METFHGDPTLKAELVNRCRTHEQAGRAVHGVYWQGAFGGGCAMGMMATPVDALDATEGLRGEALREIIATRYGLPDLLLLYTEGLYEHMGHDAAQNFTSEVAEAIPVGVEITDSMALSWCCGAPTAPQDAAPSFLKWLRLLPDSRLARLRRRLPRRGGQDVHRAPVGV